MTRRKKSGMWVTVICKCRNTPVAPHTRPFPRRINILELPSNPIVVAEPGLVPVHRLQFVLRVLSAYRDARHVSPLLYYAYRGTAEPALRESRLPACLPAFLWILVFHSHGRIAFPSIGPWKGGGAASWWCLSRSPKQQIRAGLLLLPHLFKPRCAHLLDMPNRSSVPFPRCMYVRTESKAPMCLQLTHHADVPSGRQSTGSLLLSVTLEVCFQHLPKSAETWQEHSGAPIRCNDSRRYAHSRSSGPRRSAFAVCLFCRRLCKPSCAVRVTGLVTLPSPKDDGNKRVRARAHCSFSWARCFFVAPDVFVTTAPSTLGYYINPNAYVV
ncbi:hypothetical protein LY76DRAFT_326237 [Colletotrichum caudatum]|nr:hypothetical protein LY76DRAFT_326237 [Colletotrichum caudatum]